MLSVCKRQRGVGLALGPAVWIEVLFQGMVRHVPEGKGRQGSTDVTTQVPILQSPDEDDLESDPGYDTELPEF